MNVFIGLTGFVYLYNCYYMYFTYGVVHVVLATGLSLSLSLSRLFLKEFYHPQKKNLISCPRRRHAQ